MTTYCNVNVIHRIGPVWSTAQCSKTKERLRAPSQYPKRRLYVRYRKVSKPRDWYFKLSYRFEIWQAHRQHCCRSACQVSERSDNSKYKSRRFETLRDLTERRLFGYWDGAQVANKPYYIQNYHCGQSDTHMIGYKRARNPLGDLLSRKVYVTYLIQ